MIEHWEKTTLGQVCEKVGVSYQPQSSGTLKYVGLEHIESGNSILKAYGSETEVKSSKTKFESGQILYGKLRPYLNKAVIAPFDGVCSTDILVFDAKSSAINEFLIFLLHSDAFIKYAKATTSGVQHPRTSWPSLKEFGLSLPPISEQYKIAYILSTIQGAIEQQNKLIEHTTELKKALMQKLFTEGTKGEKQQQTKIGLIPESWEVIRLGDSIKIKGGFAFKSEEGIPDSGTQLVRMGNLYQNILDLDRAPIFYPDNYQKEFPSYVLNEGDLIMSLTGTMGKEDYGFTVKVPKTSKMLLLNQRVAKFEIIDADINQDYLKQYFLSRVFLDKLYKTAKGTKQANLSSNEMRNLLLLKPKLSEQHDIAHTLGLLESKIEIHVRKKQILTDLFKTLLHELMTGQRRVHEIDFPGMTMEYPLSEAPLSMAAEQ